MVNDKIVNDFMEKKIYNVPLIEVSKIVAKGMVLAGSPITPSIPVPPHPGAPGRVGSEID